MTERGQLNFRIDKELLDGLRQLTKGDPEDFGISFHVRQAIREYLKRKGVNVKKAERKRAGTRTRS